MRGNPTGAMGPRHDRAPPPHHDGRFPIVNLPGCPVQPDNITETLLQMGMHVAGVEPMPATSQRAGPAAPAVQRMVQEGCGRAGFAEQGEFAQTPDDSRGCLVKLGCMGPVVKCNVPVRGWVGGVGGCPNVGGICIACTMPGFPDRFMPFVEPSKLGLIAAAGARFTYGPVMKRLRRRAIRHRFDVEPGWRKPGEKLGTGYEATW